MKKLESKKDITVCIVEDDKEIRESLAIIIEGSDGFQCTTTYPTCEAAITKMQQAPDAVLMDIDLPGKSGIEGVEILKARFPSTEFIMLTISEETSHVFDSLCAGAGGYLKKNTPPSKILDAIQEVITGGSPMSMEIARLVVESFRTQNNNYDLTEREKEILQKLCGGHSYKMIAADLNVDINTVKFHIKNIYNKLQVNSKGEAISKSLKENLI
ncbi:MAG: response regulator transcription factor [Balneolaceae bacterium]